MTSLNQAPVLIFPDWSDKEGVLVWPPHRQFRFDEPFEIEEEFPHLGETPGALLTLKDHRDDSRIAALIVFTFEPPSQKSDFEIRRCAGCSEVEWDLVNAVAENLKFNPDYLARLALKSQLAMAFMEPDLSFLCQNLQTTAESLICATT